MQSRVRRASSPEVVTAMWGDLSPEHLSDTTWSNAVPEPFDVGAAAINQIAGLGPVRPRNLLDCQAQAAIGSIDQKLTALRIEDPGHYYAGDFDALLERRLALVEIQRRGPRA